MWQIPRLWTADDVAFLICGGPSVADLDLSPLTGRRVIVINSSYLKLPTAEFLFFGDARWWGVHRKALESFAGHIVTVAEVGNRHRVHRVRRKDVSCGLSMEADALVMGRTSLQASLNLAFLLGSRRMVVIGADMQPAADGRTHHHDPHPWPQRPDCWAEQMQFLEPTAKALHAHGVDVRNVSPVSRIPWWPKARLEQCL